MPLPMPREPPVIKACFPFSDIALLLLLRGFIQPALPPNLQLPPPPSKHSRNRCQNTATDSARRSSTCANAPSKNACHFGGYSPHPSFTPPRLCSRRGPSSTPPLLPPKLTPPPSPPLANS